METTKRKPWVNWLIFASTIVIVFLLGLLASSIIERRGEAQLYFQNVKPIADMEPSLAVWGENFPRQYESYLRTADTSFRSKYMGTAWMDMLEHDPQFVVLWAGYLFSHDYNQGRGHYYAVSDVHNTLRVGSPATMEDGPQPGTCWTCKSSDVPRLMRDMGVENFYKATWASLVPEIRNHIGCADCHQAGTMQLQITRPALIEAFARMGRDIVKNRPTHQEMRSLVCAQCHVEYYFKGDGKYLTFPWDKGFDVEAMEAYYDSIEFTDWTHKLSRAPMLKAQHPDYEVFMMGIHAKRGLACGDCHMPYMNEGGIKFTNHHMQSPLAYIDKTCQVCHRESKEELLNNVYSNQDKVLEQRKELEMLLVRAHVEAKKAWDLGATEAQMKAPLQNIRHAQWRWDFVAASHGGPAHAPVECLRILSSGINKAQAARLQMTRILISLGHTEEIPFPPIETKAKAQEFIGLDMPAIIQKKNDWRANTLPAWIKNPV